MPEDKWITTITRKAFDNMLLKEASHNYDDYGLVSMQVLGLGLEGMPKEVKWVHCKLFESKLD